MKRKIIFTIISIILIILGITSFFYISSKDKYVKYYPDENSYEISLENAKVGEEQTFKLNKEYQIKLEYKKISGEELTYDIYVNDNFLITTTMVDFSNSEFDTDTFHIFGKTLVYFSTRTYKKEDLHMYIVDNDKIKQVDPEYDEIKGLRLHGFMAYEDKLEVIASRRNDDETFTYGDKTFSLCQKKIPNDFKTKATIEATYTYELKNGELKLTPKKTNSYNYKEYLIEGDEIICE